MKRCVIIGGAVIENYEQLKPYLRDDDFNIFCDSGLRHRNALGIEAHLIVGDFDSYPREDFAAETIVLPCEKDDTDTVFAVKEALKRGAEEFLLLGVIGGRLDHTLGNVSILLMLDKLGKKAMIVDDRGEMEIAGAEERYIDEGFAYFSLLNISGLARGITIKNAKYPLERAEITCEYQYGISNEVLPGEIAKVTVDEGRLLLIKIRQE